MMAGVVRAVPFAICLGAIVGCSSGERPAERAEASGVLEETSESFFTAADRAMSDGDLALAGELFVKAREKALASATSGSNAFRVGEISFFIAECHRGLGSLAMAIAEYRTALEYAPGNVAAHERLGSVLLTCGFRWEAEPSYRLIARSGDAKIEELALYGDLGRAVDQRAYLDRSAEYAPEDPCVRLGIATHNFAIGEIAETKVQLSELLADHPELLPGQAILGEILLAEDRESFLAWHSALPESASENPDIWVVRGLWARQVEEVAMAASCFAEAIRRVPNHRRAVFHLAQVLTLLENEHREAFHARADALSELTRSLDTVLVRKGDRSQTLRSVAEQLERLGRIWEACAWAVAARQKFGPSPWQAELLDRNRSLLRPGLPFERPDASLVPLLAKLETPTFNPEQLVAQTSIPTLAAEATADVVFSSNRYFPEFRFANGVVSDEKPRMFEQNGGGVAVIDFDGDARPDIFFTQGQPWPFGDERPSQDATLQDALFRLVRARYVDVTSQALETEFGFGQGVSVGDFNSDGFPDLYVGNVGKNQLLLNQGDGTFQSADFDDAADDWTASVVLADINGDGDADLFDTNYLRGSGIYVAICDGRACSPSVFRGVANRLRMGTGDGGLSEVAFDAAGDESKSLGVVCLPVDGKPALDLFVANDQTPNEFYSQANVAREGMPQRAVSIENEALMAGVAYDDVGLAMACMGIAAADVDDNGLIDLFVTNFSNEDNTLYSQDFSGIWRDVTPTSGLAGVSYPYVGWGTQFLDANLDGLPDLVLTNGNVDDGDIGEFEFEMRPQFFRNIGRGRFVEEDAATLGNYFQQKYLGRGLARIDWNADGRPDFVVSNMNHRAELVTNQTATTAHFLTFSLTATRSQRDAIGAKITVTNAGRERVGWLLAGDGFQASNERTVHFGLADAAEVDRVEVAWPSGATQTLENLACDVHIHLVEGSSRATVWQPRLGAQPISSEIRENKLVVVGEGPGE